MSPDCLPHDIFLTFGNPAYLSKKKKYWQSQSNYWSSDLGCLACDLCFKHIVQILYFFFRSYYVFYLTWHNSYHCRGEKCPVVYRFLRSTLHHWRMTSQYLINRSYAVIDVTVDKSILVKYTKVTMNRGNTCLHVVF